MKMNIFVLICVIFLSITNVYTHNKYSKEANAKNDELPSLRTLEKPYRMAKLNMLWTKAQLRLSEPKLKSLFGELKIHDKEEITFKRLKAEQGDKEGLKEAELRKKLIGIMSTYDLLEHYEDIQDPKKIKPHAALNEGSDNSINKSLFKDKKLSKLWTKAEQSGFSLDELKALKEEFQHHQEKIDQYYSLLAKVEDDSQNKHENSVDEKLDRFNMLDIQEDVPGKDFHDRANMLREQHRDLRDGYDRLHRLAATGPNSKEFVEPKVQGLWRIAVETNFTADELESLRVELKHYENRLLKLRHMQAEHALSNEKNTMAGVKSDGFHMMEENIKKQARKVEKIHLDLESKIMQKHVEL